MIPILSIKGMIASKAALAPANGVRAEFRDILPIVGGAAVAAVALKEASSGLFPEQKQRSR